MQVFLIILGGLCILAGIVLAYRKSITGSLACFGCGILLLLFATPLGKQIQKLKFGKEGLEVEFREAKNTEVFSNEQLQQKAQGAQTRLYATPQGFEPVRMNQNRAGSHYDLIQYLQEMGYIPASTPIAELKPGAVLRVDQPSGNVRLYATASEAFPQLKTAPKGIDIPRFSVKYEAKHPVASKQRVDFACSDGILETASEQALQDSLTDKTLAAIQKDPSLFVVSETIGCTKTNLQTTDEWIGDVGASSESKQMEGQQPQVLGYKLVKVASPELRR